MDKTLNNLKFDPLELIHYEKTSFLSDNDNFILPKGEDLINIDFSTGDYFESGMELIEDEYLINEENLEFSLQPNFLKEINSNNIPSFDYVEEIKKDENLTFQEKGDAISLAADFLAGYVSIHPTEFENGTVDIAEEILGRELQFIFDEKFLGFGSFFKKVFKAGKRVLRKIVRWVIKQIKKVVGIGKPELHEMRLVQYGKPELKLSNPIKIKGINARLDKLKIKIPYYFKFPWQSIKWRYMTITINNRVGAKIDGDLHFTTKGLKIYTNLKLNSFKIDIKVLGTKFKIGLTGIANEILMLKKFEIYDVSSIAKPIQVPGLLYNLKELVPVGMQNGLRLDLNIDVTESESNLESLFRSKELSLDMKKN
ncbi:MAG: hypothetical protein COA88_09335 [Kordia sp.]|nr:MAG: hypothetical protein COA88_09335 [Kordia sp.]